MKEKKSEKKIMVISRQKFSIEMIKWHNIEPLTRLLSKLFREIDSPVLKKVQRKAKIEKSRR